jgi:hypothetical protein
MAEPTMKAERTTAVENLIVVIEDGCFVLGFDRLLFGVEVALYGVEVMDEVDLLRYIPTSILAHFESRSHSSFPGLTMRCHFRA